MGVACYICETERERERKRKKEYRAKLVVVAADVDCVNAVSIGDQRQFEQEAPSWYTRYTWNEAIAKRDERIRARARGNCATGTCPTGYRIQRYFSTAERGRAAKVKAIEADSRVLFTSWKLTHASAKKARTRPRSEIRDSWKLPPPGFQIVAYVIV